MWVRCGMKRQTLAVAAGFEKFGRTSRRAEFLSQMDVVMPWAELLALIEPHSPDTGKGRPPVGIERMLRIPLSAAVVQLVRPGGGGCALRVALHARFRWHRSWPRTSAPPPSSATPPTRKRIQLRFGYLRVRRKLSPWLAAPQPPNDFAADTMIEAVRKPPPPLLSARAVLL